MRSRLKITQARIIDVAQKLFAELSFYRTTMKDIASAAKISRRTLYTYYKCKEDIFNQIVDQKIEMIHQKLIKATATALPADKRLKLYIKERFHLIAELMCNSEYIKKTFLYNNSRIEILRKIIDAKELELLEDIFKEGVQSEIFNVSDSKTFAAFLQPVLKSLEFGFIRRYEHEPIDRIINEYTRILFYGIIKK